MKLSILIPVIFILACKADSSSANNSIKSSSTSGAISNKEPEPIMGGPTNITITFTDYKENGTARIVGFYSDQNYLADTVLFSNGVINYKNPKGLPQGIYYFGIKGRNDAVQLVLGEDQEFSIKTSLFDIVNTIQVDGSEENKIMYDNLKFEAGINPKIQEAANKLKGVQQTSSEYAQLKAAKDALESERLNYINDLVKKYPKLLYPVYKLSGQNPKVKDNLPEALQVYHFRKEFWDNVNFNDTRLLRTPVIGNKLKRYIKEITPQVPDSIIKYSNELMAKIMNKPEYFKVIANYIVLTYEPGKSTVMDSESIFVNMVKKYFTRDKAFWSDSLEVAVIQQRANEMSASLLGKKAPNVISTDNFGKKQELYAKTADYLIVYMYNPDCEHCQEQTPKLYRYWQENKDKGVDVYAIAIDTDDKKWKDYIAKNNLTWTNVHDPTNRSIYGKYWVDVTPEIYVMNKDRILIGKNLKVDQIQIIIDRDKNKNNPK